MHAQQLSKHSSPFLLSSMLHSHHEAMCTPVRSKKTVAVEAPCATARANLPRQQLCYLQVTFPGCTIPSPSLAQPTFNDIKHFASAHRVDFVTAAYIQTAEDVQYLRRFMVECDHGETISLIARIENMAGLKNVDDILGEADGIMLCRGSLSCELGPEKLALMQKLLAAKAQAAGKLPPQWQLVFIHTIHIHIKVAVRFYTYYTYTY